MFKSAAAKLAHNSTLPSLNITGNKDLKPLQDLITAEKAVLSSLQRLNIDLNRASEALRVWGNGEGDDLGDILNASCNILSHFTASLLTYATHEQVIRDHMKAIRTKEEALDELKRRRKSVGAKADAAEKKLQKMNSENKNLPGQTDLLNRLRDEMRTLDGEIMNEEASISDFKRQSTLEFMSLKFGGLAEVSGKGVVVGDVGKLILAEIPLERTQPGLPRAMYQGHSRIQELVSQAQQRSAEVQYGAPTIPAFDPGHQFSASNFSYHPPTHDGPPQPHGGESYISSPIHDTYSQNNPRATVDDFGVNMRHSTLSSPQEASAAGGRFATFPVRPPGGGNEYTPQGYSLRDDPPSLARENTDDNQSFSNSVAAALHYAEGPGSPVINQANPQEERLDEHTRHSLADAAPPYEMHTSHSNLQGPPPGAALANPWGSNSAGQVTDTEDGGAGLAYLGNERDDDNTSLNRNFGPGAPDQTQKFTASPDRADFHRDNEGDSRVPPPRFSASSADEERQLNADAAREIGREMDQSSHHAPALHSPALGHEPDAGHSPPHDRDHFSPLDPPNRPFAQRVVSPGLTPDVPQSPYEAPSGAYNRDSFVSYEPPPPRSPVTYGQPAPSFPIHNNPASPYPTSTNNTPYGTPSEFPRSPAMTKSTSSLTAPAPGTRTISAAAFRRPQARHTSFGSDAMASPAPIGGKRLPNTTDGPEQSSQAPGEPQDYIGAHSENGQSPGSPRLQDYGALGHVRVANAPNQQQPSSPGYGEGRFATNLDGGHH